MKLPRGRTLHRNNLVIFSTASSAHVVDAYQEIIAALNSEGVTVKHVGLSLDLWNGRNASEAYRQYGCEIFDIPRASGNNTPAWHTQDIHKEIYDSLGLLRKLIEQVTAQFSPDVFLIADDRGQLEVSMIRYFNARKIPVVLLEHGVFYKDNPEITIGYKLGNYAKKLSEFCLNLMRPIRRLLKPQDYYYKLARVNKFGHNGNCLICSYSEMTKERLLKYDIPPSKIRDTGFPHFDRFFRAAQANLNKQSPTSEDNGLKILLISSGQGIFGRRERAEKFYNFLLKLVNAMKDSYKIFLRLKPGERLESFLNEELLNLIKQSKIEFDNNTRSLLDVLPNYNLIMGEPSSVLLEAVIMKKPVILTKYYDSQEQGQIKIPLDFILDDILGILKLTDYTQVNEAITAALSEDYINRCSRKLVENERFLFHRLDGKAGYRVAQVILEQVSGKAIPTSPNRT
jgi:hypothetical protein